MPSLNDLATPLNGLVEALLRSPLHFVASKGLLVLSWEGRQSGRRFSIPLGYQEDGAEIFVLISKREEKRWWKNFRSSWPAELTVRGERRDVLGEVVPVGSPRFFELCTRTLQRLPWMGSQFGGFRYDRAHGLDDAQRALLEQHAGVVCFRPRREARV